MKVSDGWAGAIFWGGLICISLACPNEYDESVESENEYRDDVIMGDLSDEDGSPTVGWDYSYPEDDPATSNDESNDQRIGNFGTVTLSVYSYDSGNWYTLDGDVWSGSLERLYFPRGGWIDFFSCELDEDLEGECIDEDGSSWTIDGEW